LHQQTQHRLNIWLSVVEEVEEARAVAVAALVDLEQVLILLSHQMHPTQSQWVLVVQV
jgi:hypothetical protein